MATLPPNPLSITSDAIMIVVEDWPRGTLTTSNAGASAAILNRGTGYQTSENLFRYVDGDYPTDFTDTPFCQQGSLIRVKVTDTRGNLYTDVPECTLLLKVQYEE